MIHQALRGEVAAEALPVTGPALRGASTAGAESTRGRGIASASSDVPPGIDRAGRGRDLDCPGLVVEEFLHQPTSSFSYLVYEEASRIGVLIDPVSDFDPLEGRPTGANSRIAAAIDALDIDLHYALETRVHCDHFTAAPFFQDRYGASTVIAAGVIGEQRRLSGLFEASSGFAIDGRQFDMLVRAGEVLRAGPLRIEVLEMYETPEPPETPVACVAYRIGDALFVGDTPRISGIDPTDCSGSLAPSKDSARRAAAPLRVFPGTRAKLGGSPPGAGDRTATGVPPASSTAQAHSPRSRAAALRWNLCAGRPVDYGSSSG